MQNNLNKGVKQENQFLNDIRKILVKKEEVSAQLKKLDAQSSELSESILYWAQKVSKNKDIKYCMT